MGFEGWSLNDMVEYSNHCNHNMKVAVEEYLKWKKKRDEVDEVIKKKLSEGEE